MARMNPEELEHFLSTHGLCRLACLEADGTPYIVPLGYIYTPEGLFIRGRARAAWAQYLQHDPRVSLMVEDDAGPRAQIQGAAELIEGPVTQAQSQMSRLWRERATREGWLEVEQTMTNEPFWYFRVHPTRVTTSKGDWAKRYKHSDW